MEESKFKVGDKVCCTKICGINSCAESFRGEDEITRVYEQNCRCWYEVSNTVFSYLEEDLEFADKKFDVVNNPKHYTNGKYECIDVMLETQGVGSVKEFCICNAFKYIYRHKLKNGDEDLRKARYYLNKWYELNEGI